MDILRSKYVLFDHLGCLRIYFPDWLYACCIFVCTKKWVDYLSFAYLSLVEDSSSVTKQYKKDSILSMSTPQLCLLAMAMSLMIIAVGSMADWFVLDDRA